jgi:hypothetical protein
MLARDEGHCRLCSLEFNIRWNSALRVRETKHHFTLGFTNGSLLCDTHRWSIGFGAGRDEPLRSGASVRNFPRVLLRLDNVDGGKYHCRSTQRAVEALGTLVRQDALFQRDVLDCSRLICRRLAFIDAREFLGY